MEFFTTLLCPYGVVTVRQACSDLDIKKIENIYSKNPSIFKKKLNETYSSPLILDEVMTSLVSRCFDKTLPVGVVLKCITILNFLIDKFLIDKESFYQLLINICKLDFYYSNPLFKETLCFLIKKIRFHIKSSENDLCYYDIPKNNLYDLILKTIIDERIAESERITKRKEKERNEEADELARKGIIYYG